MGLDTTELYESLRVGNGGWCRYQRGDLVAFVRVADVGGRLVVVDEYLTSHDGAPLSVEDRRDVPRGRIQAWINAAGESVRPRLPIPGPDLRRAAEHYATSFGERAPAHWARDMLWSQLPGGPLTPKMPRRAGRELSAERVDATVDVPTDSEYPRAFYEQVASVYRGLVPITSAPAKALALANGVSTTTAHRWIRRARQLDFLPPATNGRAG